MFCINISDWVPCPGKRSSHSGGVSLGKGENPNKFVVQTREMLRVLEKLLHSPKGSISFVDSHAPLPNTIYRRPATDWDGKIFDFVLTGTSYSCNPLLCRTVDMLVESYQNWSYFFGAGRWFYDYARKRDNSPESIAKTIYQELYSRLSEFYGGALGIDFDIITALAEAAYEKDAAVGCLFFYTGQLSPEQLAQWCIPVFHHRVPLRAENVRHMRKLLAGTGNDKNNPIGNSGLLFVRETDGGEYNCCGYIKQEFYLEALASVYIDGLGGWKLNIGGQASFCIKDNRAFLPPSLLEGVREKLENELGKEYGDLFPVLEALSAQGHGTSVVFLDLDKKGSYSGQWMRELAERGRAVAVDPIPLQSIGSDQGLQAMLKNISRVDGAVVVDYPHREIRYTNVIVDGMAVISGRPDAGARHNALRAFVANLAKGGNQERCPVALACIFSEDGGVSVETASDCRQDMEAEDKKKEMAKVQSAASCA